MKNGSLSAHALLKHILPLTFEEFMFTDVLVDGMFHLFKA